MISDCLLQCCTFIITIISVTVTIITVLHTELLSASESRGFFGDILSTTASAYTKKTLEIRTFSSFNISVYLTNTKSNITLITNVLLSVINNWLSNNI